MSTKPRIPEKVEQVHIIAALRGIGAAVYVLGHPSPADGRTFRGTSQSPGLPDLVAFVPIGTGAVRTAMQLWVEVKAADGRLSAPQRTFQELCATACISHVVGGLNEVYAWLLRVGAIKPEAVAHYRQEQE